jgi:glutamyl-tRNA synthetase
MSSEDMISWFDIDDINRGATRFDFAKLESLNAHYLRARSTDDLFDLLIAELPHLPGGDAFAVALDNTRRRRLKLALPLLKERARTLNDLIESGYFIVAERPLVLDEAASKLLDKDAVMVLARLVPALSGIDVWTAEGVENAIKSFAEAEHLKLGKIAQPLRAVLTGRTTSPGIFEVLAILGREECLARIGDQIRI